MTEGSSRIPVDSIVLGVVPILPFSAAALGAWLLPAPWPKLATELCVIWAALVLAFVAGVRRGYGFGTPEASKRVIIVTMMLYFVPAGAALILGHLARNRAALVILAASYLLVMILDVLAARQGNAPRHFSRLRGPQMAVAVVSLLGLLLAAR